LFPWLTVRGNISFGLRRFGGRREVTRRVQHYIERFGLSGFDRSYPAELSGGMQQRVALARTLITEPRMLLLDEPFASLDGYTRAEMQEFLLDVLRTEPRTTTVLVTHDVREAVFVSDRVAVMVPRPGRISAILDIPDPAVPGRTREWTYGGDFNELIATVEHQSLDARAEGSTEPGVKPPAGSQPVRSSTKV
jgi:ABC-type nitrate/sulfonate/bicarbonate transport system ATPase subunit